MAETSDRKALNLRLSARLAYQATRKAVSEVTPSQRDELLVGRFSSRPRLKNTFDYVAAAPAETRGHRETAIFWAVDPDTGALQNRVGMPIGTARHEVAHQLIERKRVEGGRAAGSVSGEHRAMEVTDVQASGAGLRGVQQAAGLSMEQQMQRIRRRTAQRAESRTSSASSPYHRKLELIHSTQERDRFKERHRRLEKTFERLGIDY